MELNLNAKGFYNDKVQQLSIEQFIGIFPNAMNDDLCSEFVNWFNEILEQGLTMSSLKDSNDHGIVRKDVVVHIPAGLPSKCFPESLVKPFWKIMEKIILEKINTPVH